MSNIKLAGTSYTYTGKAIKPKVTVANASEAIAADNYTATYSKNTNVGTATAKKGSKSFKKYFKINKTTGKVTIKKNSKMKKGTYKVKVKVKALGNANYKASAWKTVTFKVKVK